MNDCDWLFREENGCDWLRPTSPGTLDCCRNGTITMFLKLLKLKDGQTDRQTDR